MMAHSAVAPVCDKACPNYAAVGEALPAASPLAVRKGCAFPSRENTANLVSAAGKAHAFPAARGK